MSGDRLSAEREQEIRAKSVEREWDESLELLAELDAVRAELALEQQAGLDAVQYAERLRADLAQARKDGDALRTICDGIMRRAERAEAALAAARKERDEWKEACEARGLPVNVQALIDHERNNGKLEGAFEALAGGGGDPA